GSPVGEDAGALREHLEGCAACRRELSEIEEALALLPHDLQPQRPAPSVKEQIMERVREEARSGPRGAVLPLVAGRHRAASGTPAPDEGRAAAGPRSAGGATYLLLAASFLVVIGAGALLVREHQRAVAAEGHIQDVQERLRES